MTYPAWFTLMRDPIIAANPAAMRVYAHLVGEQRAFHQPVEVKVWAFAELLHCKRETVRAALNLLVERGYFVEHPREANETRRFTIAYIVEQGHPERPPSAA